MYYDDCDYPDYVEAVRRSGKLVLTRLLCDYCGEKSIVYIGWGPDGDEKYSCPNHVWDIVVEHDEPPIEIIGIVEPFNMVCLGDGCNALGGIPDILNMLGKHAIVDERELGVTSTSHLGVLELYHDYTRLVKDLFRK